MPNSKTVETPGKQIVEFSTIFYVRAGGVEDESGGDARPHQARVQGEEQPQGHRRMEPGGRGENETDRDVQNAGMHMPEVNPAFTEGGNVNVVSGDTEIDKRRRLVLTTRVIVYAHRLPQYEGPVA